MPPPRHRKPTLSRGDYVATDGTDQMTDQMVGARRVLIEVVCDVLPEFVQTLRADVYPAFAQVVAPRFWEPGWHFRTWDTVRDANRANRLTFRPVLLRWATRFGAHDESWLLEGALTTLSRWHRVPALRESLDIT